MTLARRDSVEGIDSVRVATMRADQAGPSGPPVTRRVVLTCGLGIVAATAAGALVGIADNRATGSAQAPAELVAARDAERALIAAIDASLAHEATLRTHLAPIRADHSAHLAALEAAIGAYPTPAAMPAVARAAPLDRAGLRAAERTAAAHGAQRAAVLTGRSATLLASIAACEASHAELLT